MFQEEYIKSVLEQDLLYDEEGRSCTNHTFFPPSFCGKPEAFLFTVQRSISTSEGKRALTPMIFYRLINAIVLELSESRSAEIIW